MLDRVVLLDVRQAQFSPIMSLYRDAEGDLQRRRTENAPDAIGTTPVGGDAVNQGLVEGGQLLLLQQTR